MSLDVTAITTFSRENTNASASCPSFHCGFVLKTSNGTAAPTDTPLRQGQAWGTPAPLHFVSEPLLLSILKTLVFKKPQRKLYETRLIKQNKQNLIKHSKTKVCKRCLAS